MQWAPVGPSFSVSACPKRAISSALVDWRKGRVDGSGGLGALLDFESSSDLEAFDTLGARGDLGGFATREDYDARRWNRITELVTVTSAIRASLPSEWTSESAEAPFRNSPCISLSM